MVALVATRCCSSATAATRPAHSRALLPVLPRPPPMLLTKPRSRATAVMRAQAGGGGSDRPVSPEDQPPIITGPGGFPDPSYSGPPHHASPMQQALGETQEGDPHHNRPCVTSGPGPYYPLPQAASSESAAASSRGTPTPAPTSPDEPSATPPTSATPATDEERCGGEVESAGEAGVIGPDSPSAPFSPMMRPPYVMAAARVGHDVAEAGGLR